MAIIQGDLTLKTTELLVVYSEDPSVEVPEHLIGCGWVPAAECRLKRGADQLLIRSLSPEGEWPRYRDILRSEGEGSAEAYLTATGTLKANNSKKKSEARLFVQRLSLAIDHGNSKGASKAHHLLAMRIIGLTKAVPVESTYTYARIALGYEPDIERDEEETPVAGKASPPPGADGFELDSEEGTGTSGATKSA